MTTPDTISVLMAFDAKYAPHAAACIASLLRTSPANFAVTIASSGDPGAFAPRLRRSFAGNHRVRLEIRQVDIPTDTEFPLPYTLTLETYLRFWAGELLPGCARALYLDPDIIAVAPVDALWRTDLQGKVLGAVPIPNSTRPKTHGMPPGSLFFNVGVLLLDVDAWRSRRYRERCLAYLRAHPERALDGDQDILNLCTQGDWLPLDYTWNVISPFYRPSHDLGLPPCEVERIRRQARLIHFNGANKPWTYLDNHPRKADYLLNRAQTDWRDWRPADRTLANRFRKRLRPYVPKGRTGKALIKAARTLHRALAATRARLLIQEGAVGTKRPT